MTDTKELKRSTTIRLGLKNYECLKNSSKLNNRNISGQANSLLDFVFSLQKKYPSEYFKLLEKLNMLDVI